MRHVTLIGGPCAGKVVTINDPNMTTIMQVAPIPIDAKMDGGEIIQDVAYRIGLVKGKDNVNHWIATFDYGDPLADLLSSYIDSRFVENKAKKQGRIEGLRHALALTADLHHGSAALVRDRISAVIKELGEK